jgi:hypothetical protein
LPTGTAANRRGKKKGGAPGEARRLHLAFVSPPPHDVNAMDTANAAGTAFSIIRERFTQPNSKLTGSFRSDRYQILG